MQRKNEVQVKIGEVKLGRAGDLLRATLGSCVGILFIWKQEDVAGLAHCLLPLAESEVHTLGAKYVSQAIPSLVSLMRLKPENYKEVKVHLFGGGNMMSQWSTKSLNLIGTQNVEAAQRLLAEKGFRIASMDVEGDEGRQVQYDCETGQIHVLKLPKAG